MSFRSLLVLFCCAAVAGCGFRPLYGDFEEGSSGAQFLKIEIDYPKDREGQVLHNELVRQLHGGFARQTPIYRLRTELRESQTSLAVKKSAFATRGNLNMSSSYWLVLKSTGEVLATGVSQSTVSYNILDSEFATLFGEKNARERAIREISHDIRIRIGGYFDRQTSGGS